MRYFLPTVALAAILISWFSFCAPDRQKDYTTNFETPNYKKILAQRKVKSDWTDSLYNTMSEDERIGQVLMIRAHTDKGADYENTVLAAIRNYHVGGVCFFQGNALRQAQVTNTYQQAVRIPLLVAIDGEWGLSMRLKETMQFPHQMTLGAIQNNDLIYSMGEHIGKQCRRIGINCNFAPVIDCNTNPKNPVIGDRSFGEDKTNVAAKGFAYANGMQQNGVMACAKHFPGHGDAAVDSHLDLPVIPHSTERLNDIELFPFKALAAQGVMSMMIAHLSIPAWDATPNQPSTLSRKIVTGILREECNFQGLIFTDAMEMQGVAKFYPSGKGDVQALQAGNDVVLMPQSTAVAFNAIKAALANGTLDKNEFEAKVKRVLGAKHDLHLHRGIPMLDLNNINADLHTAEAESINRQLYQNALTLVRNDDSAVPITDLAQAKIASVCIGGNAATFQRSLSNYAAVTHYNTAKEIDPKILPALKSKSVVIVSLHNINRKAGANFGVSQSTVNFINNAAKSSKVIVCVFGSAYGIGALDSANCVVAAYEDNKMTQELAAQGIFGAFGMTGRLPVTVSTKTTVGSGVGFKSLNRLRTAVPEEVGLNSDTLAKIDAIANSLIAQGAAPGCQVMVVKNGAVVFHHTYGFSTYQNTHATDSSDLYDMASVTKIMATTGSLMTLHTQDRFDPEKNMGDYLPELKGTNKANLQIKQVMAHQAGLTAWIPFYQQTVDEKTKKLLKGNYKKQPEGEFDVRVCENMYIKRAWTDKIWQQIYASEVAANPKYKYSDLGFITFAKTIKAITGEPIDVYTQKNLYEPLGMAHTTFKPLEKFDKSQIIPSENDQYWRHSVLQGDVHDMAAAMIGGVSGHAGLFSNAHDVATFFQMLLQNGNYAGKQYIAPETVKLFTTRVAGSTRRGLGFDMKDLASAKIENVTHKVSDQCFGHTGFVGQSVWADPKHDLIYVFLSNRTFPTMDNKKMNENQWRTKIHDVIYRALR
jgi:beta-N-acetylhexosaminidase